MEQNQHIALPLEALFIRLEAAGFRMDTARKMRLLRVLEEEGPELYGDFGGLKYRLSPYIARNPQEQERFYAFFDQFFEECVAEARQLNEYQETQPAPLATSPPGRKFNKWWLVLLLIVPVLALWNWPSQPEVIPTAGTNNPGDSLMIKSKAYIGDKPYLQTFAVKRDFSRQLMELNGWYWLLAILPFLSGLWLLARWWKKRNEKIPEKTVADLEAAYPIHDAEPYFVPYLPEDAKITVPRDFFRMAEVMRRREEGIRRSFDVATSVKATVEAGGYPEWREKSDTRPAEYLFLVQRSDERNQQARLFERLTAFLKRREAPAEVFFHSGRFDVFKNPEHPHGLNLAELKQQYPLHRLVLLGDGHGLVNPYNPEVPSLLTAPVKILSSWPRRLLLTPEPVSGWSFQEALLHRHFLICPADTDGILAGLEMLDRMEEYEPGNYGRREAELLRLHPQISHRYRRWETPEDHKAYLQDHPDWYRWLCALCVCVQPDWALTIAIGRAIGVEVTHDGLLTLSRIPWLNDNAPDTNLRLALLRQLDPADEALARNAVAAALQRVQDRVAGSFAETDWTTGLAIQRFALDPRDEGHKTTLRELRRLGLLSGAQLAELDLIVQEKMPQKDLPARVRAGGIASWLEQPASKPLRFRELAGGLAAMLLSAFLLAYGFYYNRTRAAQPFAEGIKTPAGFWVTPKPLDDQAIELNNRAVELWEEEQKKEPALMRVEVPPDSKGNSASSDKLIKPGTNPATLTDSLLQKAMELRLPAMYTLADSNRLALRYNFATRRLKLFLDSIQNTGLNYQAGLQSIRDAFAALTQPAGVYSAPLATVYKAESLLCLAALHGQGLCDFYLERRDSAQAAYERLLALSNNRYFDTLNMQVNLKTLLTSNPIISKPNGTQEGMDKVNLPDSKQREAGSGLDSKNTGSKTNSRKKPPTKKRLPPEQVVLPPETQPDEPPAAQYAPAIKNGALRCPEGSFFDAADGGTCWSCPAGYQRTKAPVNGATACIRAGRTEYGKATYHGNGSGKESRECERGQFWEDYNKGTCWSCAEGFSRARSTEITSTRACERVIPEARTAATKVANATCPDDSFFDIDETSCWSCPPNYTRTIYPVNGNQACELMKPTKKN